MRSPLHHTLLIQLLCSVLGVAIASLAAAHPPPGPYQEITYELTAVMETSGTPGGLGDGVNEVEDTGTVVLRFHDPGLDNIFEDGAEVQLAAWDFNLLVVIGGVTTDVKQLMEPGGDAHGYFDAGTIQIVWESPVTKFHSFGNVFCPLGTLCAAGALEQGNNPQDDTIDAEFQLTQFVITQSPPGLQIIYPLAPDPSGTQKVLTYTGTEISRVAVPFDDPTVRIQADPPAVGTAEATTISWVMAGDVDTCSPLGDWPMSTPDATESGSLGVTANGGDVYALSCSFESADVTHASLVVGSRGTCGSADLNVGELLNDECYEATQLTSSTTCGVRLSQSTTAASLGFEEPVSDCAGEADPSKSVWYAFTSPETQFATLSTAGSDFPTVVAVWWQSEVASVADGQCGELSNQIDVVQRPSGEILEDSNCSADVLPFEGPSTTEITFKAVAGKTYLIQVADVSNGGGGNLDLTLTTRPAVALGGDFDGGDPSQYDLAWTITGERDSCTAGADWSGDIADDGTQQVPYMDGGSFYTLSCSDPATGTTAASLFQVDPDACPGVVVEDKGAPSLINDECGSAMVLQAPTRAGGQAGEDTCPVVVEQNTLGASVSGAELGELQVPSCLEQDPEATVWFEYTPPFSGVFSVSTEGSDYPTFISVWRKEQGCGEFDEEVRRGSGFACIVEDDFVGSSRNILPISAEGGLTLLIQIGDVGDGDGGDLRVGIIPRVTSSFDVALSGDQQTVGFEWETKGGYQECVGTGTESWQGTKTQDGEETVDVSASGFYGFECVAEGLAITNRSAIIAPQSSCSVISTEGSFASVFNDACEGGANMVVAGDCPVRLEADTTLATTQLRETLDDNSSPSNGAQISPCAPPIGPYPNHSVWYRWTATTDEEVTISTVGSSYPTTISVWGNRGGCNNLPDEIGCNQEDMITSASQNSLSFTPTAGNVYFIQVADSNANGNGTGGDLDFLFRVPEPGNPLLQGAALASLLWVARRRRP